MRADYLCMYRHRCRGRNKGVESEGNPTHSHLSSPLFYCFRFIALQGTSVSLVGVWVGRVVLQETTTVWDKGEGASASLVGVWEGVG